MVKQRWLVLIFLLSMVLGMGLSTFNNLSGSAWAAPLDIDGTNAEEEVAERIAPILDLLLTSADSNQLYIPSVRN